jgi:hypothetical protein
MYKRSVMGKITLNLCNCVSSHASESLLHALSALETTQDKDKPVDNLPL